MPPHKFLKQSNPVSTVSFTVSNMYMSIYLLKVKLKHRIRTLAINMFCL